MNNSTSRRCRSLSTAVVLFVSGLFVLCALKPALAQTKSDWKTDWDRVVSRAKQEGKVVVWASPGQQLRQAMTDGFRKAFPEISVEWVGARGGDLVTRLQAERDGGVYSVDVIAIGADTSATRLKPMKAIDPIRPALILPEVTDTSKWLDQRLEYVDNDQQFILAFVSQGSPVAAYDPKQARPADIDNLYDLLNPKWMGKILISDPLPPGAANSWFHWVWNILGAEKATDYFRKIRAQAGAVTRDWRRDIEWIAQGKYAVLVSPSLTVSQQLKQEGVEVGMLWEFKDYGTWLTTSSGTASLVNRAPHPNAAKVFINWLLTREGQTLWSKVLNAVSRRTDVSTGHLPQGVLPRPGVKYWKSYPEDVILHTAEEERVLKEIFR